MKAVKPPRGKGRGAKLRRQLANGVPPGRNRVHIAAEGRILGTWVPFLRRTAARQLRALSLERCELSVSLVADAAIRRLNRVWRRKDKATDVLSFPAGNPPPGALGLRLLGDVVISLDTAERQAHARGVRLQDELARYLAHGLLHLLGHDHERPAERRRMSALEEHLLGRPGLIR